MSCIKDENKQKRPGWAHHKNYWQYFRVILHDALRAVVVVVAASLSSSSVWRWERLFVMSPSSSEFPPVRRRDEKMGSDQFELKYIREIAFSWNGVLVEFKPWGYKQRIKFNKAWTGP